jgi:DNA-binding winged helix-turn-helix (wHTH) protein
MDRARWNRSSPETNRIILAHENSFTLGPLTVTPPTRCITHTDGRREVLEPRVMQVLVALVRAGGDTLTREDLTSLCWQDRVVGDDAISRVLSRLRRTAEGLGAGVFRIETITKVGYRLTCSADAAPRPRPGSANGLYPDQTQDLRACAYLMVTYEAGGKSADIIAELRKVPDIGLIHGLTGPADLVVRLDSPTIAGVENGRSIIQAINGVASVHTAVVLARHLG